MCYSRLNCMPRARRDTHHLLLFIHLPCQLFPSSGELILTSWPLLPFRTTKKPEIPRLIPLRCSLQSRPTKNGKACRRTIKSQPRVGIRL